MDLYAEQVLTLLDELGVDQVVLGMPVLEWAAPAAALVFALRHPPCR